MSFLLDTNVLSEPTKLRPDLGVLEWLAGADEDRLFLSAVSLAEIHRGIERLPEGARRRRLHEWLNEDLVERFSDRILPVEERIAASWGLIMAQAEKEARSMALIDGFLAATAQVHELTLVTRNSEDFKTALPRLLNPWRTAQ